MGLEDVRVIREPKLDPEYFTSISHDQGYLQQANREITRLRGMLCQYVELLTEFILDRSPSMCVCETMAPHCQELVRFRVWNLFSNDMWDQSHVIRFHLPYEGEQTRLTAKVTNGSRGRLGSDSGHGFFSLKSM